MLEGITQLHVAKGKKTAVYDLVKDRPNDAELVKLMTGPTGNLRAPTLRRGKKLIVGFHNEMYDQAL